MLWLQLGMNRHGSMHEYSRGRECSTVRPFSGAVPHASMTQDAWHGQPSAAGHQRCNAARSLFGPLSPVCLQAHAHSHPTRQTLNGQELQVRQHRGTPQCCRCHHASLQYHQELPAAQSSCDACICACHMHALHCRNEDNIRLTNATVTFTCHLLQDLDKKKTKSDMAL